MSEANVLSAGLEELYSMKEAMLELEGYSEKNKELSAKEVQLEKEIALREKQLAEKIASVTKSRYNELEQAYDEQVDKTRARIRKVSAQKEKTKNSKVSERIEKDTEELRNTRKQLLQDIKAVYKANKIPGLLNNSFIHAIYLPGGIRDGLIIFLSLAVILFAFPCGIYYFLLPHRTEVLVVTYILTVLVFGAIYVWINRKTKEKHPQEFVQIRELRKGLAKNRQEIRRMEKSIRKDKDESSYGLDKYDKELAELNAEVAGILEEQKAAIRKFDEETKKVITEELTAEQAEEMTNLRKQYDSVYEEQRKAEEKEKSLTVTITDRYHTYLGKENMDIALIDQLAQIIEAKKAATIGEALAVYRKETTPEAAKSSPEKQ